MPPRAPKCRGKASIAIFVADSANETPGGLRLQWHRAGHSAQCRRVDALARGLDRDDLRHRLAPASDANRVSGGGPLDELAQMRFGIGEIYAVHFPLLTLQ